MNLSFPADEFSLTETRKQNWHGILIRESRFHFGSCYSPQLPLQQSSKIAQDSFPIMSFAQWCKLGIEIRMVDLQHVLYFHLKLTPIDLLSLRFPVDPEVSMQMNSPGTSPFSAALWMIENKRKSKPICESPLMMKWWTNRFPLQWVPDGKDHGTFFVFCLQMWPRKCSSTNNLSIRLDTLLAWLRGCHVYTVKRRRLYSKTKGKSL